MKTGDRIYVGDRVYYKIAYPRKASERFRESLEPPYKNYLKPLTNIEGSGQFIGYRFVIMDDYKYHPAPYDYEMSSYDGLSYVTGKKEKVLLVVENEYRNPIVVRIKDSWT